MKYLIVTADDFGLTHGTNLGTIECFKKGIVTSASILINSPWTGEAVSMAKENPELDVGLHLTLADNKPILPIKEVVTLVDKKGGFSLSHLRTVGRLILGQISLKEVKAEFEAQIRRFLSTGLRLSHLNCHGDIHIWPSILPIVIHLAERYNIGAIRIPTGGGFWKSPKFSSLFFREKAKVMGLGLLNHLNRKRLKESSLFTPNAAFEVFRSENDCLGSLEEQLINISEGVSEFYCHPAVPDNETTAYYKRWRYPLFEIVNMLTDSRSRSIINKEGIILGNYKRYLAI